MRRQQQGNQQKRYGVYTNNRNNLNNRYNNNGTNFGGFNSVNPSFGNNGMYGNGGLGYGGTGPIPPIGIPFPPTGGLRGPQGPKGDQGIQGPKGDNGASVPNIGASASGYTQGALADKSVTTFTYSTEEYDTGNLFTAGGSIMSVPTTDPGRYLFSGTVTIGAFTPGAGAPNILLEILAGGKTYAQTLALTPSVDTGKPISLNVSGLNNLTAGLTVSMRITNNSGDSFTPTAVTLSTQLVSK